jgi:hypothetical protein
MKAKYPALSFKYQVATGPLYAAAFFVHCWFLYSCHASLSIASILSKSIVVGAFPILIFLSFWFLIKLTKLFLFGK